MDTTPTPLWQTSVASLLVSVAVFLVGYLLVYRRQLAPMKVQLADRTARLAAQQASEALTIAKAIFGWYPVATSKYDRPHNPRDLPAPEAADDARRLANDPVLRDLLASTARLLDRVHRVPQTWANVALHINRDEKLVERLGALGIQPEQFTSEQNEYLAPFRERWVAERDEWGAAAERLNTVAERLRERAEELLRAVPA